MKILVIILALAFAMPRGNAQTTNAIPPNLYLTDDGKVFWYKRDQRLVSIKKIEEAKQSPESRPAGQDPEGHWGIATNGFQLGLRFEKEHFTNGEPVVAVMLMRNISDKPQNYFRLIQVSVVRDGKELKRKSKGDFNPIEIHAPLQTTLFPQAQNRYQENLSQIYDLNQTGEYVFQAVCRHPEVTSQKVGIVVTNSATK
jgi:hypothetical protein